MLAKGFISGIMWERVFEEEDFYLRGSRKAYAMAKKLSSGIEAKDYKLTYPFESNQIFVNLTDEDLERWKKIAQFEVMDKLEDTNIVRLVTTFRTSESDVRGFLDVI